MVRRRIIDYFDVLNIYRFLHINYPTPIVNSSNVHSVDTTNFVQCKIIYTKYNPLRSWYHCREGHEQDHGLLPLPRHADDDFHFRCSPIPPLHPCRMNDADKSLWYSSGFRTTTKIHWKCIVPFTLSKKLWFYFMSLTYVTVHKYYNRHEKMSSKLQLHWEPNLFSLVTNEDRLGYNICVNEPFTLPTSIDAESALFCTIKTAASFWTYIRWMQCFETWTNTIQWPVTWTKRKGEP